MYHFFFLCSSTFIVVAVIDVVGRSVGRICEHVGFLSLLLFLLPVFLEVIHHYTCNFSHVYQCCCWLLLFFYVIFALGESPSTSGFLSVIFFRPCKNFAPSVCNSNRLSGNRICVGVTGHCAREWPVAKGREKYRPGN